MQLLVGMQAVLGRLPFEINQQTKGNPLRKLQIRSASVAETWLEVCKATAGVRLFNLGFFEEMATGNVG